MTIGVIYFTLIELFLLIYGLNFTIHLFMECLEERFIGQAVFTSCLILLIFYAMSLLIYEFLGRI